MKSSLFPSQFRVHQHINRKEAHGPLTSDAWPSFIMGSSGHWTVHLHKVTVEKTGSTKNKNWWCWSHAVTSQWRKCRDDRRKQISKHLTGVMFLSDKKSKILKERTEIPQSNKNCGPPSNPLTPDLPRGCPLTMMRLAEVEHSRARFICSWKIRHIPLNNKLQVLTKNDLFMCPTGSKSQYSAVSCQMNCSR